MVAVASALIEPVPVPRTRLIGRDTEHADARAYLFEQAVPLLTLTGPGGVGKTRFALAVAQDVAAAFADGVVWVDLTPLADAALVPSTIATAVGVTDSPGRPLPVELGRALRSQQMLLLVDNCEHVLAETAALAGALLARCQALQVLTTIRAPLRLQEEQLLPVQPLPLPADESPSLTDLGENDAVRLFVERTRVVQPAFVLSDANAATVSALCRQQDGLPLAIELAAARSTLLSPEALLAQMTDRLRLLRGGARNTPVRHQQLHDPISWTYALLSSPAQTLLRRLAVFAGGCTLAAAQSVAAGDADVVETLGELIGQSLFPVMPERAARDASRFEMLETIHAFAQERLVARGEEPALRDRHAAYYLALVERLDAAVVAFLPEGHRVLNQLETEQPNLRLALSWYAETGNGSALLRLASALNYFWQVRGGVAEETYWLERALALGSDAWPGLRAAGLFGLAGMLRAQGNAAQALPLAWKAYRWRARMETCAASRSQRNDAACWPGNAGNSRRRRPSMRSRWPLLILCRVMPGQRALPALSSVTYR